VLYSRPSAGVVTIFVKRADKGSTVTITSEGLNWEEKEE
jgi:hypothetical protein